MINVEVKVENVWWTPYIPYCTQR